MPQQMQGVHRGHPQVARLGAAARTPPAPRLRIAHLHVLATVPEPKGRHGPIEVEQLRHLERPAQQRLLHLRLRPLRPGLRGRSPRRGGAPEVAVGERALVVAVAVAALQIEVLRRPEPAPHNPPGWA